MSAGGHTAGPWTLETVQTSCGICHKVGPFPASNNLKKETHACVYVDYPGRGSQQEELLANARLIAAAPELLEALKMVRFNWAGHAEQCRGVRDGYDKCDCDWPKIAKQIDAALDKAVGR